MSSLQSAGDTRWTLAVSVVAHVLFLGTLAVIDRLQPSLLSEWLTATFFVWTSALVWFLRFKSGAWRNIQVIEEGWKMSSVEHIALRVNEILDKAKKDAVFPGYAASIISDDGQAVITSGCHTYDSDAAEVTPNSVFDVASLTKVIPVSCCALKLIEQKKLSTEDPLIKYVPQFRGSFREQITVRLY
jgi:CubicO group peptidase (beta-lactamase class C family)